jgi:hypothetical protein
MKRARNMLARWLRGPRVAFPRCPYCGRTRPDTPVYVCGECRGRFCEPCTHEWEGRREPLAVIRGGARSRGSA